MILLQIDRSRGIFGSSLSMGVFDQESHVTRGGRGISSINVMERRILGENLSLFITKQDHACNYVSLR